MKLIAEAAMAALRAGTQVGPFSRQYPGFDLPEAYTVAREVTAARRARGETPVGRKIGFTNRAVWDSQGLAAPLWAPVYDTTLRHLDGAPVALPALPELRIEPEIAFGLGADPTPEMADAELLECIDRVACAFELVFSIFPGWRFAAADAAAAFGVHAALLLGEARPATPDLGHALATFTVELRDGRGTVRHGGGANVLGSPLAALRFLLRTLADDPLAPPLRAGEIVTTGTLTEAMPLRPGDKWSVTLQGLDLPGIAVTFIG